VAKVTEVGQGHLAHLLNPARLPGHSQSASV